MAMKFKRAPEWLDSAVIYEVYPQSFSDSNGDGIGDLPGLTAKLPYIAKSGFNAVWLNPWFASPFRDAGYDIEDFYRIAPRYGTNADAKTFMDAAHKLGLKVLLDLVMCHTAIEHPALAESGKVERNEKSDMYIWCPQLSYRGDKNEKDDYYVSGWSPRGAFKASFFAVQPAINYGFGVVKHDWEMPYDHPSCRKNREAMKNVMRFWLDMGCDGFRVDMASCVAKRDPGYKYTSMFWNEVRHMFDTDYPEAVLISEWFEPEVSLKAGFHIDFFARGMFRNDNWMSLTPPTAPIVFTTEERRSSLKDWLKSYLKINAVSRKTGGFIGMFSGNHDVWRLRHYSDLRGMQLKMALLLTFPGCPTIYYGDEIGMRYLPGCSVEGSGSRGGSRTPMQWEKGKKNLGFSTASAEKLYLPMDQSDDAPTVSEALAGKNPLYDTVTELVRLRHEHKALQARSKIEFLHGAAGRFPLIFRRSFGRDKIIVAINPTADAMSWSSPALKHCKALLEQGSSISDGTVSLAAESFGIYAE